MNIFLYENFKDWRIVLTQNNSVIANNVVITVEGYTAIFMGGDKKGIYIPDFDNVFI